MSDALDGCVYEEKWADQAGWIWVCVIHDQNSKHPVDGKSHLPCLAVDPYEEKTWNVFEHSDAVVASEQAYGRNPIEGTVSYPKRQHPRDYIRLIEED